MAESDRLDCGLVMPAHPVIYSVSEWQAVPVDSGNYRVY